MTVSPTARLKVLEKTRLLKALKSLPPPEMAGRILITAQRTGTEETAVHLKVSRRRDCFVAAASSSPFSRCFNRDGEGVSAK